ncbi:hypothetical protein BD324DRAFT_632692 [Kockovaella imperatae]|uniref:AMP-activated protein kinase glycogen-binding domain-containing protein n=1 Tax=Kockovaella imperatae TaxID=4999 RepID=A0A1Y1UD00_9TREE|nr:hypothetical protein BD324DRAFT_632692 [Kockovaella imperatae]ORX35404.1 hypothetical protein BD324DRAFT_632692 [Kockovaella imperatae]
MSQHKARFTWGVGPEKVFVAGGFNNWSGDASPLEKQADGTFAGEFEVPWGEKQAFKYVVDGEWKVREDEAKEWDAAGNMNNVYTAPHKPEAAETATAPAPAAATTTSTSDSTTAQHAPETLLASSAPAAAGSSEASTAAPVAAETTPAQIEKTAANTDIGASSTAPHEDRFMSEEAKEVLEKAAEIGAGALAALGAAVGGAVVAAEKAIGVDVTHSQPMSLDEAKAQGIDVNALEEKEAPTDAVSPVGTKPSADGIAALEEKAKELKLDSHEPTTGSSAAAVSLSEALKSDDVEIVKHDIPAQDETTDSHKTVPAPIIVAVGPPDAIKDRSLNGAAPGTTTDSVGTKPIDSAPDVSAVEAKRDAEQHPALTGSTPAAAQGKITDAVTPSQSTATEGGLNSEVVEAGAAVSQAHGATGTTLAHAKETSTATTATTDSNAGVAPPATPAKKAPVTAASTPAKSTTSTPGKDADGRKRKTSFFKKMKEAFSSPKDKEKK